MNTYLCFHNWHRDDPFIERYRDRAIYDLRLGHYSKVSSIIAERSWRWPCSNSIQLMKIKEEMEGRLSCGEEMTIQKPMSLKGFTCTSVWEKFLERKDRVPWYGLVWHKHNIPR